TWLDVPKADSFGQVAGMYVNLLTDLPASDMYVATGLELTMRSPKVQTVTDGRENGPGVWHVLARHARQSDKAYVTDVYVFDAATGALEEVIMGLRYVRVAKATMGKILARVTVDKSFVRSTAASPAPPVTTLSPSIKTGSPRPDAKVQRASSRKAKATGRHDITEEVRNVVANVSGIEASEMTLDSEMADLGIDSLMGMELAREVENTFKCTLDQAEQMEATNLRQFIACVSNALARAGEGSGVEHEEEEEVSDDNESDDDSTATGEGDSTTRDDDTASDISTPDDVSGFTAAKRLVPSSLSTPASTTDASAAEAKVLNRGDVAAREADAERLVAAYTTGWESALLEAATDRITTTRTGRGAAVVVTGASGSLGTHLVQTLAARSDVATVVCINRPVSNVPADKRQADAMLSRGIKLSAAASAKLRVYDTDTFKPQLGLPAEEYAWVARHGTHIIHNAWPMSGTRPLKAYEPQIRVMRNLLDLARDMATTTAPRKIGFQLVSSIGVVGFSDGPHVLEQPVPMAAVMPSGYNEGKWVCERMLTETLRRHPRLFRASVARPGQISGSTASGVWNPVEHFPFLVKSAQALKVWPDLQGVLHWLPVDRSAGVMVDLLKIDDRDGMAEACPVYHIDNPVGQPWKDMSTVLAAALGIPPHSIIPFQDWIKRVRQSPLSEKENPAARVIGFLEGHFERMACGGIILDTQRASEHSETMAMQGPVSDEVVRSYVSAWKTFKTRYLEVPIPPPISDLVLRFTSRSTTARMASDTTYTVEPKEAHTHTVIFLHGRDSNCKEFADELFESEASEPLDQPRTLQDLFPNIRWVFPSAPSLQSKRFGTDMSQWFDMWSVENPAERPELQHAGLHQSIKQILGVIKKEEILVPRERIFLAGISQGTVQLDAGCTEGYQRFEDTANIEILASTPIFLSHSVDDNVVPIKHGRELRNTLQSRRLQVEWGEYEDGGHWVNEPQGIDDIARFMNKHMACNYLESPEE
ncbi:hypothetical protein CHU98_g11209, partial [Xylaria longipes]